MSASLKALAFAISAATLLTLSACREQEEKTAQPAPPAREAQPPQQKTNALTPPPPPRTLGEHRQGEATYYHATGKGNCSFDAVDNPMVAAINNTDYANAAMCGAHIAVTGPKGSTIVRIVDRCPGCPPGGLDLSKQAFEQIADTAKGRVAVSWQVVAGPATTPVSYHYMDGTTRYWTAIQIRNHRWPVEKLSLLPNGATEWLPVERRRYNYFVRSKPIAAGPLKVRITAATGETLEDTLPEPQSGLSVEGQTQFR